MTHASSPGRFVLVAVDTSPQSLAALETAARVAAHLNAELRGIYVEDIDLVRTAELPFACTISFSGQPVPLTSEALQRQLSRQAAIARNAVEAAGLRSNLTWSFLVTRGSVDREIAEAGSLADLITVGRTGWSGLRAKPLGSVPRSLAIMGTTSVLMVGEHGLQKPVVVIDDGGPSSDRAIALATALDGNGAARVAVLRTESSRVEALVDTIRKSGSRTIVIPSTALTRYRELAALLDQKDLSIFLVK